MMVLFSFVWLNCDTMADNDRRFLDHGQMHACLHQVSDDARFCGSLGLDAS